MRRTLIRAGLVAATLLAPLALHTPLAQGAAADATAQARVIVKYRADSALLRKQVLSAGSAEALRAASLGQRLGIAMTTGRAITDRSQVVFASGLSSQQLAARIAAESDVEYAVADEKKHIVAAPNDSFYATRAIAGATGGPPVGQWYLKPPGAAGTGLLPGTAPAAINAEQAWDITTGSASIVVADLDTGLRFDHPDLQGGNFLPGYDMVSPDDSASGSNFSSANDGNGRDNDASDPGDGITSAEKSSNPLFASCTVGNSSWHGTQTAGLIGAATNNGVGIASVGRNVRVMPVRVLGKCGGYDSDIQAGMLWAAGIHVTGVPDNTTPARVLNMSLGGTQACTTAYADVIRQVNALGTVVVVAAGNSGGNAVGSPASCAGAIGVTALRHVGDKVGFSDLGPQIAIAAPGGNCVNTDGSGCLYPIMTTSNSGAMAPVAGVAGAIYTDSFNTSIGTSFSAPLVSGTVALMLSSEPTLTAAQVKTQLQATARPFPSTGGSAGIPMCVAPGGSAQDECYCTTSTCGAGMLDARAAVASVSGVHAAITLTTTTPTAGQSVAFMSSSVESAGHTITSYAWSVLNVGTTGAAIVGANNASTVTVTPSAAGTFLLQLTTTDSTGFVSTTTLSVVVVVAAGTTPPASTPTTPAPSGGGGGALGVGWLLLLLSAVLALALAAPRERAALSAAARPSRRR